MVKSVSQIALESDLSEWKKLTDFKNRGYIGVIKWQGPMIVYSIPGTSTVISNSKYKVWINYRDGWGCTYANVKKWEEINGE